MKSWGRFRHQFDDTDGGDHYDNQHIDFPVRDPLDTIISWRCFQGENNNNEGCRRYETAIKYLSKRSDVHYHIMENYKAVDGKGPQRRNKARKWLKDRDLEKLKTLDDVVYMLEWLKKPHIKRFFDIFYQGRWYECDNSGNTQQESTKGQDLSQATYQDERSIV